MAQDPNADSILENKHRFRIEEQFKKEAIKKIESTLKVFDSTDNLMEGMISNTSIRDHGKE